MTNNKSLPAFSVFADCLRQGLCFSVKPLHSQLLEDVLYMQVYTLQIIDLHIDLDLYQR